MGKGTWITDGCSDRWFNGKCGPTFANCSNERGPRRPKGWVSSWRISVRLLNILAGSQLPQAPPMLIAAIPGEV
jgi:hypothetical protein